MSRAPLSPPATTETMSATRKVDSSTLKDSATGHARQHDRRADARLFKMSSAACVEAPASWVHAMPFRNRTVLVVETELRKPPANSPSARRAKDIGRADSP